MARERFSVWLVQRCINSNDMAPAIYASAALPKLVVGTATPSLRGLALTKISGTLSPKLTQCCTSVLFKYIVNKYRTPASGIK